MYILGISTNKLSSGSQQWPLHTECPCLIIYMIMNGMPSRVSGSWIAACYSPLLYAQLNLSNIVVWIELIYILQKVWFYQSVYPVEKFSDQNKMIKRILRLPTCTNWELKRNLYWGLSNVIYAKQLKKGFKSFRCLLIMLVSPCCMPDIFCK